MPGAFSAEYRQTSILRTLVVACFSQLVRVFKLVKDACAARGMWCISFVENVVCDEEDQKVFRESTRNETILCLQVASCPMCEGPGSTGLMRNWQTWPRWCVSQGLGYEIIRPMSSKEPVDCWVSPGWEWVSAAEPVPLPTFTRSIPRSKPPHMPAGISHTPREARKRWREDQFRYPPYTYKVEYCLSK